ncbi:MAG: SDR family oxidoreductase, partial [Desulfobacterales bacterium]
HGEKTRGWELLNKTQQKSLINHTLLERTGTLEDVVNAVLFVVKDAPFITGSVIKIDGGYTLGGETVQPMPKGVV